MRKKLSPVMIAHYISFTWRTALCVILLILWIGGLVNGKSTIMYHFEEHRFIMTALWVLFMCEMIARLFPSGIRSPGCQKQFARNFKKTGTVGASEEEFRDGLKIAMNLDCEMVISIGEACVKYKSIIHNL